MRKNKNCVQAETETYKVQKLSPTHQLILYAVSLDIFSVSVFVYFPVLVFKSLLQTNGIYSLIIFLDSIQIVDLKSS